MDDDAWSAERFPGLRAVYGQEQRSWIGPAAPFQPSRYPDQCARSSSVIARLASVS